MNDLLAQTLDAHGGMDRWNGYEKVEATIVSGGGFFALKGVPQDANPRHMTVWLHEERSFAHNPHSPTRAQCAREGVQDEPDLAPKPVVRAQRLAGNARSRKRLAGPTAVRICGLRRSAILATAHEGALTPGSRPSP